MPAYEQRGLHGIYLGDEAIIHCDRFTLEGGEMKPVRSAVSRVGKRARFKLIRESDAGPELVRRLNEISAAGAGTSEERGFTMELGRDVEGDDPDFLLGDGARRAREHPVGLPAARALLRRGPRLLARPDAPQPRRRRTASPSS